MRSQREAQGDEVADQGRGEDRDRHDFGGKDRLGDEVLVLDQRGRRAAERLLEQQPGQKAREEEKRIILGDFVRSELHFEAGLEHERPAPQQHQGVDNAPQPAGRRADEALCEVAADELKQEVPALHQVAEEMRARHAGHRLEF